MLKLFLFVIIGLIISYIFANEFFAIATKKGYNDSKYFWYCFLFGIAGYLMVVALPQKTVQAEVINNKDRIKQSDATNATPNDICEEESAKFTNISEDTIVCSACNFEQPSGRKVCWKCGRHFSDN